MRFTTLSCLGPLLLTASLQLASAGSLHADDAIDDYVNSQGYKPLDLAQWSLAENLDAALTDIGLARKDADLTAIEKALLVLDLEEEPLTRVRYAIRLGASDLDNVPLTFLQIDQSPIIGRCVNGTGGSPAPSTSMVTRTTTCPRAGGRSTSVWTRSVICP